MRPISILLAFFMLAAPARAEDPAPAAPQKPYVQVQRSLEVNRSLITRAEAEYAELSSQLATEETARRMEHLRYKIQALKDDAARLLAELPKSDRAHEFLKELTARRAGAKEGPETVDVEREKRLAQKVEDIFSKHDRALELVAEKRYDEAARLYEDVLLISPDDDEAYLLLGHCRMLAGHYDKARAAFLNAIHIDPANRSEITGLYEDVLLENPQDDAAYTHLGFAHWTLGNRDEAQKAYRSALEINPGNLEARAGLVQIAGSQ